MKLTVAHTPDPDDSFMFYAMFEGKIDTHFDYSQVIKDIETLNKEAIDSRYDVTAVSANAYAMISDDYSITSAGSSFGISYGPIVLARRKVDLSSATVGVPGFGTSAFLLYRMFAVKPSSFIELRFDRIVDAIEDGTVDAGIIIHDEQLAYRRRNLLKILDLYEEWKAYAGDLPIPLGFNAIRKDLGEEKINLFLDDFIRSIKYGQNHEKEAVKYALRYARYSDMDMETKFIRMYVNDLTVDMGKAGRRALDIYYGKAFEMGLLKPFRYEVVSPKSI